MTGSDQNVYPPMSLFLETLSIPVLEGYSPKNLHPKPDLVIVGNVITRDNPESTELTRLQLPYLSFPQAIRHFALHGKHSIVISGTHGKTTTTSLAAWILEQAGMDVGFMIGGIARNFQRNFKLGKGEYFVIEGDEYDTAFFDKGPKFLHYRPEIAVLTSIEFDHADIYRDLNHIIENFRKLIDIIPINGFLIANGDDAIIVEEIKGAACAVVTYGLSEQCLFRAVDISADKNGTHMQVLKSGRRYMLLNTHLYGLHNISNLLSVVALADYLGILCPTIAAAVETFKGVHRRQEVVGEKRGILILDDFAHHPTAVRETTRAVKEKHEGRRLVAVFEPRSNSSRRNIFQAVYSSSFDDADIVMIAQPPLMENIPPEERFSPQRLVTDLNNRGLKAFCFANNDQLLETMVSVSRPGDVFLIMSNGGFDNIPRRFLESL